MRLDPPDLDYLEDIPEDERERLRKIIAADTTRFIHFNGS